MDTVLSQKCAAVLDVRLGSDVKMLETLALLSSLTDNDDSKTQHMTTLRSSIEASSLAAAKEFVAILKTVESEVSTLSSAISKIHSTTALISESITAAETAATLSPNSPAALIANAVKARDSAIDSQKALTAFKTRFQLANDTTAKLQFDFEALPPNEPIPQDGYDFLEALATVNAVKESLVTASRTTANDLVGKDLLPMLETLSTRHTIAQNKLYSFLQAFLHLDSSPNATAAQLDAAYADPFTPTAINLLTPAFQFHVVEMVGQARRLMLATTFLTALTSKGGEGIGGMSHDPVGYVGNIAAWVHQAVAAEQVRGWEREERGESTWRSVAPCSHMRLILVHTCVWSLFTHVYVRLALVHTCTWHDRRRSSSASPRSPPCPLPRSSRNPCPASRARSSPG